MHTQTLRRDGVFWNTYIIIQLTPYWGFSVTDYIKYYAYLCYLLA
jgi:hypothetical protein